MTDYTNWELEGITDDNGNDTVIVWVEAPNGDPFKFDVCFDNYDPTTITFSRWMDEEIPDEISYYIARAAAAGKLMAVVG